MKGKKCFGLLLLLSIMVGLSLNVSLDVNALKHEYIGITPIGWNVACLKTSNGINYFDYSNCNDYFSVGGYSFAVGLFGDSWPSTFDEPTDILPRIAQSIVTCEEYTFSSSSCTIDNVYSQFHIFDFDSDDSNGVGYSFSLTDVFQSQVIANSATGFDGKYKKLQDFVSSGVPFNLDNFSGLNDVLLFCPQPYSPSSGCISGRPTLSEYARDVVLPYWYSSDGFYIHSHAINPDNGISYSHTFSLSDMYNYDFPKFSSLLIPFNTNDSYWFTESNLYSGRSIDFKGTFEFDGSFSWNFYAVEHGVFQLRYEYIPKREISSASISGYVDCTTNLITVEGLTRLEYSCPVTLPEDLIWIQPYLYIAGDDNDYPTHYVWETNDKWRFGSCYIVTDNDDTPGSSFNSSLSGGGDFIGDASNDFASGDEDWFSSLTNLFNFTMLNPFTPIFALFTNQSTCASIPTIAGMIHSEQTQVCPWFSAETRAIVTPVVGIVSTMLIFGFAVRWLGSRSGNFIEDSDSHEIGSIRVGRKGRK